MTCKPHQTQSATSPHITSHLCMTPRRTYFKSHSLIDMSALPEARTVSSWLKATALTLPLWPENLLTTSWLATSHRKTARSPPHDANRWLLRDLRPASSQPHPTPPSHAPRHADEAYEAMPRTS